MKPHFSVWQVAALVTIAIIIVVSSTSPRTAFYSIAVVVAIFFLVNGAVALVSKLTRDIDQ